LVQSNEYQASIRHLEASLENDAEQNRKLKEELVLQKNLNNRKQEELQQKNNLVLQLRTQIELVQHNFRDTSAKNHKMAREFIKLRKELSKQQ